MLTNTDFIKNAKIYKILANPKRLKILNNITRRQINVDQISRITGIKQPNLSQHLAILRKNNLVTTNKSSGYVYYKISDPVIVGNCKRLAKLCN